jgi:poly(A) polymerase
MSRVSPDDLKAAVRSLPSLETIRNGSFRGRIYLVGGALREIALGRLPNDYDFALSDSSDLLVLEELFDARSFLLGKKPIQTHRMVLQEVSLDITFLKEGIEEDLARRDFTINAIAYDFRQDTLIDPMGGVEDLKRRVIRQPRTETIREDPLRMLKAIRHFAALHDFTIDPDLLAAIHRNRGLIHTTAPERVKYELDLILVSPDVHRGLEAAAQTGLLFEIIPELLPMIRMDREKGFEIETFGHTLEGFRHVRGSAAIYPFKEDDLRDTGYSLLFHDLGKPSTFSFDEKKNRVHFFHHETHSRQIATVIMERLRFSTAEIKVICALIESHMRLFLISHEGATDKAIRRLVYKMGELTPCLILLTLLDLYGNTGGTEGPGTYPVTNRCREVLAAYEEWKREPLPRLISGYDLLSRGFSEGPLLGKVLEEVREKQIAGEITDREQALDFAETCLKGTDV